MGIFTNLNPWSARNIQKRQERDRLEEEQRREEIKELIKKEGITCDADIDFEAMDQVLSSYMEDFYVPYNSTLTIGERSGSLDNDGIRALNNNMVQLCKRIIQQNFMLMRKVQDLSNKIEKINK